MPKRSSTTTQTFLQKAGCRTTRRDFVPATG
ncbi:hypothetical protein QTG54_013806 [Skeletonema marinoi]|uniref:Uncharacterized protein n=1 Tax=Skeletonema marinoi TaxID=267567 RepID=A0AAD9D7I5_9STRA|nr:hypothetical protein QTG54_013806 [Skeletonema marinoi]